MRGEINSIREIRGLLPSFIQEISKDEKDERMNRARGGLSGHHKHLQLCKCRKLSKGWGNRMTRLHPLGPTTFVTWSE